MTDDAFLTAFENCTLPEDRWTHRAHVRIAYIYASRNDFPSAIERVRSGIKAYNKARNVEDAIDRGYHESMTLAFTQIVFAANIQTGPHKSADEFCEAHSELMTKFALRHYYSRDRLMTMEAKIAFVSPDLCPLPTAVSDTATIACANEGEAIEQARALFVEYAQSIPHDLAYQHFADELQSLPGNYAPPKGRLLLAYDKLQPVGCVALRQIDESTCEMKRLWVKNDARRMGLGRVLATTVIDQARAIGYSAMRLDTLAEMKEAVSLYRSIGFRETDAYTHNPFPTALYMELSLG